MREFVVKVVVLVTKERLAGMNEARDFGVLVVLLSGRISSGLSRSSVRGSLRLGLLRLSAPGLLLLGILGILVGLSGGLRLGLLRLSTPRLLLLVLLVVGLVGVVGLISRLNKLIHEIILEINLDTLLGAPGRLVSLGGGLFLSRNSRAIILVDRLLVKKEIGNNLSLLFDRSKYGESVEISILGFLIDVGHLVDEEEVELDELCKLGRKSGSPRLLLLGIGLGSSSGASRCGLDRSLGGSLVLLGSPRLLGLGLAGHSGLGGAGHGSGVDSGRRDGVSSIVAFASACSLVLLRSARLLDLDVDDLCRRHGKRGGDDAGEAGDLGWCKEDKKGSIFCKKGRSENIFQNRKN
jgi:hypothetical protein